MVNRPVTMAFEEGFESALHAMHPGASEKTAGPWWTNKMGKRLKRLVWCLKNATKIFWRVPTKSWQICEVEVLLDADGFLA